MLWTPAVQSSLRNLQSVMVMMMMMEATSQTTSLKQKKMFTLKMLLELLNILFCAPWPWNEALSQNLQSRHDLRLLLLTNSDLSDSPFVQVSIHMRVSHSVLFSKHCSFGSLKRVFLTGDQQLILTNGSKPLEWPLKMAFSESNRTLQASPHGQWCRFEMWELRTDSIHFSFIYTQPTVTSRCFLL